MALWWREERMKKHAKKLQLCRETVRGLENDRLAQIAGGLSHPNYTCTLAAATCAFIPPPPKTEH